MRGLLAFPGGSVETQEMLVRFLGQEGLLGEEMATPFSILAGKIPWTEEPDRLQSVGSQRAGHDWAYTHERMSTSCHTFKELGSHYFHSHNKKKLSKCFKLNILFGLP